MPDEVFKLKTDFRQNADQAQAVDALEKNLRAGVSPQILLGATGTGKTFTMANLIARQNRPALVLAHNKTLAAQLAAEFRRFFPENAVDYFVSYYDYYQPEAYLAKSDTYIEKETVTNDEIDQMRHKATLDLLTRRDVIVVASVSCIYGLGSPEEYLRLAAVAEVGAKLGRDDFLQKLTAIQYERNDAALDRGRFRVRGDTVEVWPAFEISSFRVEFFGDEIEKIIRRDPISGENLGAETRLVVPPAKHAVTTRETVDRAVPAIEKDLELRAAELRANGKELFAQRLEQRTRYDLEMLREAGYVNGIENYTRYLSGKGEGEPPWTLLDFFARGSEIRQNHADLLGGPSAPRAADRGDYLLLIDESHLTIPQIGGMFEGNLSRKRELIEYGFRLPSALDNRPLKFDEFLARAGQMVAVSATPGKWELEKCGVPGGDIFAFLRGEGGAEKNPAPDFSDENLTPAEKKFLEKITAGKNPIGQSAAIALAGVNLSGKSTFARKIAGRLGFVHLDHDELNHASREERAFSRVLEALISRGFSVVLDAGFWKREHRDRLRAGAKNLGVSLEILDFVPPPTEVAHDRARARAKETGTDAEPHFQKFLQKCDEWEDFSPDEEIFARVRTFGPTKNDDEILEKLTEKFSPSPLGGGTGRGSGTDPAELRRLRKDGQKNADLAKKMRKNLTPAEKKFLEKITAGKRRSDAPKMLATCGISLSGKTTFSRKFAEKAGWVQLRADEIRIAFFDNILSPEVSQKMGPVFEKMLGEVFHRGFSVISDAIAPSPEVREKIRAQAKKCGAEFLGFLTFLPPTREEFLARAGARSRAVEAGEIERFVPAERYDGIISEFSRPAKSEIFAEIATFGPTKNDDEILEKLTEKFLQKSPAKNPPIVQQIIRPTGILDPPIEIRPTDSQIENLLGEIHARVEKNERVLVTTLTKKMAEDLSEFLTEKNVKVKYLHSDIDTLERIETLRDLRRGVIDVIVGINLLREGLDLPEVSLVAILDADVPGFLRSRDALIQNVGRAARNADGRVIFYADRITGAMREAIDETERRRRIQAKFNAENGITPTTVKKEIDEKFSREKPDENWESLREIPTDSAGLRDEISRLTFAMERAADELDFESAARLRDEIELLKSKLPARKNPGGTATSGEKIRKRRTAETAKKVEKKLGGK